MAKPVKWLDRHDVLDPDHITGLETQAAINEFHAKKPRHEAENEAYESYKKDQLTDAAAHHYVGMKAAHAAGDMKTAKMHGMSYELALKALGHTNPLEVPDEVSTKAKHAPQSVTRFKSHAADQYSVSKKD